MVWNFIGNYIDNIDINNKCDPGFDKLEDFCDLFNLTNLIKSYTCITKNHQSTIDLLLTNKPRSFKYSTTTETGLSDHHKLITTFLKAQNGHLKPKVIHYRNYKKFNEKLFLNDLKALNIDHSNPDFSYSLLTENTLKVLNKHAPLKKRFIGGNHAPFMNKNLRKAIYTRSRLKRRFHKNPTKTNEKLFKKQRNFVCL